MRLKQIVVNLVDNAIKYTPDGGEVIVSLAAERKTAIFEVSDTGIGIPAAALPLVFDRFFRTDQARSRESGGTGLGLSIVKAICDAHGAVASVTSVEGKGATFRIELPLLLLTATQADQLQDAASQRLPSPHAVRSAREAKETSASR
jgi:signal transduction histidine kinase